MTTNPADKIIATWETTTRESDIYQLINTFAAENDKLGSEEKAKKLKALTSEAIKKENLDESLMWLSEYELLKGVDSFASKCEDKLARSYDIHLASVKRPCRFFPESVNTRGRDLNITDLKGIFKGQRCFIIGNGPSLNELDLTPLRDEITFGVNAIFLNKEKMGFLPTFYVVEDTHVADDRKLDIHLMSGPIKLFGSYLRNRLYDSPDVIWLNTLLDYRRYEGFPHFSVDAERRLWVGGTVSYVNLQLAYYMGFSEVYLIGFDHEYSIPQTALVKGADITSTTSDPNHFHPDYFGPGYKWHVPLVERMELSYIKAQKAFEAAGRKVFNSTHGGRLNVFERRDYAEVLSTGNPARVEGKLGVNHVQEMLSKAMANTRQQRFHNVATPDVSVVVPVYNVYEHLAPCLESIRCQTHQNIEIIIVDDGSPDNSIDIANRYADIDPRVSVIRQENLGLGGARATGIKAARGNYVTFIDSDDTVAPTMISDLLKEAKSGDYDIVQTDYDRIVNGKPQPHTYLKMNATGTNGVHKLLATHSFSAWARLYKRSFLNEHNLTFEPYIYHEDIFFQIQAYYHAKKVSVVDGRHYNWISRDGSITSVIQDKHINDLFMIMRQTEAFLKEKEIFTLLIRQYLVFCYRLIKLMLPRVHKLDDKWEKTRLIRVIRQGMEDLNLDFYENIQIAQSFSKGCFDNIKEQLFFSRYFDQPASNNAPKPAAKPVPAKQAPAVLKEKVASKSEPRSKSKRKLRKLLRNPYNFFADSRGLLKHLRFAFIPWKFARP